MILDMTLFDYVCVIKPVKRVVPVQACLFVLDCADIPVVKLNPLTTPLCVHDHSGKLSLENSICSFSYSHTLTHKRKTQRKTPENPILFSASKGLATSLPLTHVEQLPHVSTHVGWSSERCWPVEHHLWAYGENPDQVGWTSLPLRLRCWSVYTSPCSESRLESRLLRLWRVEVGMLQRFKCLGSTIQKHGECGEEGTED